MPSGDDEQVRIWEMTAYQHFQTLVDDNQRWGQITVIKFINCDATHNGMEHLCFGTGRGHVLVYHRGRKSVCAFGIPIVSFCHNFIPQSRNSRSAFIKKSSAWEIVSKASPSTLRLGTSPSRAIMDGSKSSALRMGSLQNFGKICSLK